ncbi:MAG: hypothetical protein M4579_005291 [Chaenotheca gracillima]|nr:MAG: hypothetical protein M4579_005291 [Chaenotheca gracillima]
MASIARAARPVFGQVSSKAAYGSICVPRQALARPRCSNSSMTSVSFQRKSFSVSTIAQEKKYTKDHEWIELSTDGQTGTIGVSTYAANSLGDVVYVELPQKDQDVSAGDSIGAVESVKSASDIMTPISGVVIEANSALEETPGLINRDPEGATGWIAKLKIDQKGREEWDGEELMASEEYRKFTEE